MNAMCFQRSDDLLYLICFNSSDNFLIAHNGGDLVFHVPHRNVMVFSVVGIDAALRDNSFPVSLVCINRRHPDAGMSINSGENDCIRP